MTTQRRARPSRPARAGFTLMEIMLALALSMLVVLGVFGLTGMLQISEQRQAARYVVTLDRATAQMVLRSAFRRLFAAEPLPQPTGGSDEDGDGPQGGTGDTAEAVEGEESEEAAQALAEAEAEAQEAEDARGARSEDRSDIAGLIRSLMGDSEMAQQLLEGLAKDEPPHFELYVPESPDLAPGMPRLELVVTESPVPMLPLIDGGEAVPVIRGLDPLYRGAIEFAPEAGGAPLAVMQWRPIEPAGRPVVLVRGVQHAVFSVLPKAKKGTAWEELWAAYLEEDFPVAVRVELWMEDGGYLDWLFDTEVLQPEPSRR